MMVAITILHVLSCVVLVLVVLLQAGKGADIGAVFGGASTTIFGSSGAGGFLTRLTAGAAILFMTTSLMLTYGSTRAPSTTLMPESAVPAAVGEPFAGEAGEETGPGDLAPGGTGAGGETDAESGAAAADEAAAGDKAAAPAEAPPAEPPVAP